MCPDSSNCLGVATDVASVVCCSVIRGQLCKTETQVTVAKISQKCILFHVQEAWRLAFPGQQIHTRITNDQCLPLALMTSHLSQSGCWSSSLHIWPHPNFREICKKLSEHYSCLHLHLSFPADLQQSLENASDDQDLPDSQWLRWYSQSREPRFDPGQGVIPHAETTDPACHNQDLV